MDQTAQIIAALLILAGFGLSQFGVLHEKSLSYLLMNALGSEVLAFAGWAVHQWAFVILEGSWTLISAAGLAQWINRRVVVQLVGGRFVIARVRSPTVDPTTGPRGSEREATRWWRCR